MSVDARPRVMKVDMVYVGQLAEEYTLEHLKEKRTEARLEYDESMRPGVVTTGVNMKESGTTGEQRQGEAKLRWHTWHAAVLLKTRLESGATRLGRRNRKMNHIDLSQRAWGA